MTMRIRRLANSVLVVAACVVFVGGSDVRIARADPITDAATVLATNIENSGALLAVSAGRFVEDAVTGVVDVVDSADRLIEQIVPLVTVDRTTRRLKIAIEDNGRRLRAFVEDGLREGAKVLANFVSHAGDMMSACVQEGLPSAVISGIIAAITGGLTALPSGPMGVVTGAALAGMAGAFQGFVTGCVKGLGIVRETSNGRAVTFDQVRPIP
ncbi:hypothetical protein [Nocardia arthritidis]|uniref:Uncharacterized protein n=1 Tax=Nocardia arthritidis TaxID=228602 RepID=A0A6G9YEJ8_9NOCA|nr:hypothetical protein [Nocardia arthritidis]QIS11550.1 hypothetical protein F5544_18380 [Nocardia arthritidis]